MMKIAVLGTGAVGRAHAAQLATLGHQVTVGTRNPQATLARTEADFMGNIPFPTWLEQHPRIRLADYADAAADAELLINATAGGTSLDALNAAGARNLVGKVLIDTAAPNDFTTAVAVPMPSPWGGPSPILDPVGTDSLGEQIQRAFPDTKVVKVLNTVGAQLMVAPNSLGGGDHTLFISGNDPEAKQQVTGLLSAYGWSDVIDIGDITTARATEMIQPLYLSLVRTLGHEHFNLKVVR